MLFSHFDTLRFEITPFGFLCKWNIKQHSNTSKYKYWHIKHQYYMSLFDTEFIDEFLKMDIIFSLSTIHIYKKQI